MQQQQIHGEEAEKFVVAFENRRFRAEFRFDYSLVD